MKNAITTLRIQNFKSIKDVEMKPRRVNIIIGEPNVGKSNILEAMSLLGGMVYDKKRRFMEGMVRYEKANQLFFDNLVANVVMVESDTHICVIGFGKDKTFQSLYTNKKNWNALMNQLIPELKKSSYKNSSDEEQSIIIEERINKAFDNAPFSPDYVAVKFKENGIKLPEYIDSPSISSAKEIQRVRIRPYLFNKRNSVNQEYNTKYLQPPSGDNLKSVIQTYAPLRQEVTRLFSRYGLKLMLHMENKQLEVIKDLDGVIYSYPYSSTADTLQRLIFYLAAIESNDDAVILLEEPEAHSYPVYVSQLGQRIVESRNNQFFVATHSPYLITEILEEMLTDDELTPELAMFVAYYEDYRTKVRQLTDDEVIAIRADGLDVFYNMARFVPGPDNKL